MYQHPAYVAHQAAKQRCVNPKNPNYRHYGGRGVTMCKRWLVAFENFWADMGPTWQKGLTLDRTDNEKGYGPDNCRWVTQVEQVNNQRVRFDHLPHNIAQLARDTKKTYRSVLKRYHRGTIDHAVLAGYAMHTTTL